jgi:hypothetical protein
MIKTYRGLILLTLIAGLVVGCRTSRPAQNPQPEQLLIFDGVAVHTLGQDHTSYAPIARKLDDLIAGMDTPLYAFYPPERFEAEIAPLPHLEAVYGRSVTLVGKGYQVQASRLVVVIAQGDKIILTRTDDRSNWNACQASETTRFDSLIQVVKDQTGVDLRATR